jgi:hypothetical protein
MDRGLTALKEIPWRFSVHCGFAAVVANDLG